MEKDKVTGSLLIMQSASEMPRIKCRRVLIRSLPSNVGLIWLNIDNPAADGWGWPLDIGDAIELNLDWLDRLQFTMIDAADKMSVLYEV